MNAVIALGANLGDCEASFSAVIRHLNERAGHVLKASSMWASEPEGFSKEVPTFVNAVIVFETELMPEELLDCLQSIELAMGKPDRVDGVYQSRPIDLDVIDFDGKVFRTERIEIPHPRAHLRQFVLRPLFEICPDFQFPDSSATLKDLIDNALANDMRIVGSLRLDRDGD